LNIVHAISQKWARAEPEFASQRFAAHEVLSAEGPPGHLTTNAVAVAASNAPTRTKRRMGARALFWRTGPGEKRTQPMRIAEAAPRSPSNTPV
jgi:hypothetical protein